jgi:hypothetical protein
MVGSLELRSTKSMKLQLRSIASFSFLLGALALGWALAGCRPSGNQTATPGGSTPAATAAAPLGSEQAAGPFQVKLSTPATPKAGDTRFQASVTRNGQPVSDATVSVSLSMPSMQMAGPDVTLKPTGSQYEGTANLSMAGEWQAKTTVSADGESGSAVYQFSAVQ